MSDLSSLKNVIARKRKASSIFDEKIEECVFLYFCGNNTKRRAACAQIRDYLEIEGKRPHGLLVAPRHEHFREFDRLICRIIDDNDIHTNWYLQMMEVLPAICKLYSVPYVDNPNDARDSSSE